MCTRTEIRNESENSFFKTSYQRAHYYEKLQNWRFVANDRPLFRPELYFSDPILKKKLSTYRKHYDLKKPRENNLELYRRFDLTSRHTLKDLYDEYKCKPVRDLKFDRTLTGLHYKDPSESVETKLLGNFCNESSNLAKKINSSSSENWCYTEFTEPYTTTYNSHFQDSVNARKHGIGKDDIITYYNKREKNKRPLPKTTYKVEFKSFFKVPFNGDCSTYQGDYEDPEIASAFLSKACLFPGYFETLKSKNTEIPGDRTTEQKMIGSGKSTRTIV